MDSVQLRLRIAHYLHEHGDEGPDGETPYVDLNSLVRLSGMDRLQFAAGHLYFMRDKGLIDIDPRDSCRARLTALGRSLLLDDEIDQHLDTRSKTSRSSPLREGYDIAQICLNGHIITQFAASNPKVRKQRCPDCGKETICHCSNCSESIQGYYHVPDVYTGGEEMTAPKYCHACGAPYPWTQSAILAAKELAFSMGLDTQDAESLASCVDDLVAEGPRTPLAIDRFKRLTKKAGSETYDLFKSVLGSVLSQAVNGQIF